MCHPYEKASGKLNQPLPVSSSITICLPTCKFFEIDNIFIIRNELQQPPT